MDHAIERLSHTNTSFSLLQFVVLPPADLEDNHLIYRLITAYLLLRVNLDKIMHARWDFDASSARTRRVSALDNIKIEAQVHYFV